MKLGDQGGRTILTNSSLSSAGRGPCYEQISVQGVYNMFKLFFRN
jgi:hypothetical protein